MLNYSYACLHHNTCRYIIVCRILLGHFVRTQDGQTDFDAAGQSIWATRDKRELSKIRDIGERHHALLVETGPVVSRFREIVVFHSERIYPEYLLAYKRE